MSEALILCFRRYSYGVGPGGKPVVRTDADPEVFRKIRGRAKCLRMRNETPEAEFMTKGEARNILYASAFNHHYGHGEMPTILVEDCERLEPVGIA